MTGLFPVHHDGGESGASAAAGRNAMKVSVGTFNLNNLFSRYNFEGEIDAIQEGDTSVDSQVLYRFGPQDTFKIRSYMGKLVKAKDEAGTAKIAGRIWKMDLDVLAVQEVEDIDTLRNFNRDHLAGKYSHVVLVEGNDPRLIDVGVLSRLPIGAVTSWQQAIHREDPDQPVFGRDLLEVEIMNATRSNKLFTLFINHLKSHYVDFREDPIAGEEASNQRRRRQAETLATIVKARTRPGSKYIVLGDMNDATDSPFLQAFASDAILHLTNALVAPKESGEMKKDTPAPPTTAWTHRFKQAGQPAKYELYDQIWLSPALANRLTESWILRRESLSGDGSDHDPAWVVLEV
jgi:endonuclease/exonuclease/phosphatase family metal-dependent hydrolase